MTLTVKVSPGEHTIKLVKTGFFTVVKRVTVSAGETKDVSADLVETNRFTITNWEFIPQNPEPNQVITLKVTVRNNSSYASAKAKVQISFEGTTDERETGVISPNNTATVHFMVGFPTSGTKTVTIKALAYVQDHENGTGWYVTDTKTATVTVKETMATLKISTTPSGAAVYIDGVYKGTT